MGGEGEEGHGEGGRATNEQSLDKWLYWKEGTRPHALVTKARCSHTSTTPLFTGAVAALGSEGHLFPTRHCQTALHGRH